MTGSEATCEELAPTKTGTYKTGTIVDYKVNNNTTRRFYVIHDDGTTLTLQDQKNIVDNVSYATKADFIAAGGTESEWNSCVFTGSNGVTYYGCSTRGPLTILPALESATNSWTNVNLQTYTPGTTSFLGNNRTGCTNTSCSENIYTMTEHSARARLITVPEAWATGCKSGYYGTCPKYMFSYLQQANYEAVTDDSCSSWGYWTMNSYIGNSYQAWRIFFQGCVDGYLTSIPDSGARAVVEINK